MTWKKRCMCLLHQPSPAMPRFHYIYRYRIFLTVLTIAASVITWPVTTTHLSVVHCICICYSLAMKCLPPLFCSAQRFLLWNHTLPQADGWSSTFFQARHYPGHSAHYTPITPNELLVCMSNFSRTLSFLSTNSLLLISITWDKYSINVW